ncbi:tRNA dihydrouridine(20/20a) synthase DusA [Legionella oakridgensis]|uniref:tRNA-dihydrouridine synthase n=2 Tax=Legionella oakridgensis TaxID=29423 RepID=W0BG59_9GAMM|nr:tRNA dihydrouridine(20/20a) synthase DusA [Legionella oakridgensis]AHE67419.1 tRNA-dihydrouridine synthase [Legionella oakridgensis ATCC 33761 = DSM 21215]ETO92952.1 tRNA-U16,U17-dihydrouridine synthase [Legionella oakridgensis RV-2-2007]KTD43480.1 tRNA-dihydrouridine synthase A [Legionella oakridgensis]STY20472.1 tRNA-dihydrouridine synthase A [Legionella longbeachae]
MSAVLCSQSPLISSLAIAPMIDWTYTHFRVFMRMLAPKALLYTDMQTPGAVFNNSSRALGFHPMENPLALQLGGADKKALVLSAKKAEQQGFNEINLNLGCPSDRVQAGRFGACLMAEPEHVADCITAIKQAVSIPVTAKTRIGIDHQDSYDFFSAFAHRLIASGCDKLLVHARKAWLRGLNPKQNRTIPPLHYEYVYNIKQELPSVPIVINGNINSLEAIRLHLQQVDGVMLGRLACQNPYAIAIIHHGLYPQIPLLKRSVVLQQYLDYLKTAYAHGVAMSILLKPILGLAHGLPGAKLWKELLSNAQRGGVIPEHRNAISMMENMEQHDSDDVSLLSCQALNDG